MVHGTYIQLLYVFGHDSGQRAGLAIRRYWVRSPVALYMPGAHQAFHPSGVGKLVPASAEGEQSFVRPWGGECWAAVQHHSIHHSDYGMSVVKRILVISDVRLATENQNFELLNLVCTCQKMFNIEQELCSSRSSFSSDS